MEWCILRSCWPCHIDNDEVFACLRCVKYCVCLNMATRSYGFVFVFVATDFCFSSFKSLITMYDFSQRVIVHHLLSMWDESIELIELDMH